MRFARALERANSVSKPELQKAWRLFASVRKSNTAIEVGGGDGNALPARAHWAHEQFGKTADLTRDTAGGHQS